MPYFLFGFRGVGDDREFSPDLVLALGGPLPARVVDRVEHLFAVSPGFGEVELIEQAFEDPLPVLEVIRSFVRAVSIPLRDLHRVHVDHRHTDAGTVPFVQFDLCIIGEEHTQLDHLLTGLLIRREAGLVDEPTVPVLKEAEETLVRTQERTDHATCV